MIESSATPSDLAPPEPSGGDEGSDGTDPEGDDEPEPNDPQAEFERNLEECCQSRDLNDTCALFNTKYAVVNEAGKAFVYQQITDHLRKRKVLVRISYEDLKKFYQNRKITIEIQALIRGKRQPQRDYPIDC